MRRLVRLAVLAVLVALVVPGAAGAAARMWMGFQDDPIFRWKDKEDRARARQRAAQAGATVLRTTVYWYAIAPRRPANPANPFDPAYHWNDLDEFVQKAQFNGEESMLAIWGTPSWAGPAKNRLPRRLGDLTAFARAVASRYTGRNPGLPFVRFYGVWNEPNLSQFLAPQFDARGRSLAPALYARLYQAAYAGIRAGNRFAQIGIGETSARGRDRKVRGLQDTHSPGRFAELVAKANPRLRFDAWAHHPYPTQPRFAPNQKVRWPNVSLAMLPRFERSLNRWFKRRNTPIWVTEYGHETNPPDRNGVSYATQSAYMQQAIGIARRDPNVQMFIWFVLWDDLQARWQSGMLTWAGLEKPSFDRFSVLARLVDARNGIVRVRAGVANPALKFSALELAAKSGPRAVVGMTYRVFARGRLLVVKQPVSRVGIDGWVTFRPAFTPRLGTTYTVRIQAADSSNNRVERTLTLVPHR